jgi:hypothetical protein
MCVRAQICARRCLYPDALRSTTVPPYLNADRLLKISVSQVKHDRHRVDDTEMRAFPSPKRLFARVERLDDIRPFTSTLLNANFRQIR